MSKKIFSKKSAGGKSLFEKFLFKRGDIGPIADDIPSIFPIVFGVLLFMGTAVFATQRLDERNDYLEIRKAALGLSYVVTQKGYLSDSEFGQACASQYEDYAARRRVEFIVSLKKYCNGVVLDQGGGGDIFSPVTNYPAISDCPGWAAAGSANDCNSADSVFRKGRICPGTVPKIKNKAKPGAPLESVSKDNKPPNFQTLNFPVSAQCNADGTIRGPGLVNVIVWRGAPK